MLKIKDNIDLKELKKFGFKHNKEQKNTREHYCLTKNISKITKELYAWVDVKDRTINKGTWAEDSIFNDILYDLIQAGFIEKIKN